MFEKRDEEYAQENEKTIREYRERGLLVEVDTGEGTEIVLMWILLNRSEIERVAVKCMKKHLRPFWTYRAI
jgi:hypothetical protein